jgi:hypothetical protein
LTSFPNYLHANEAGVVTEIDPIEDLWEFIGGPDPSTLFGAKEYILTGNNDSVTFKYGNYLIPPFQNKFSNILKEWRYSFITGIKDLVDIKFEYDDSSGVDEPRFTFTVNEAKAKLIPRGLYTLNYNLYVCSNLPIPTWYDVPITFKWNNNASDVLNGGVIPTDWLNITGTTCNGIKTERLNSSSFQYYDAIEIPDAVRTITNNAFANINKPNIKKFTQLNTSGPENSFLAIGQFAFQNSFPNLETLILQDCGHIGVKAFADMKKLKNVSIINDTLVGNSSSLYDFQFIVENIPYWNIVIDDSAFKGCSSIERLAIPNLYSLATDAFADCTSLTRFEAPNMMTWDEAPFSGCTKLKNITIGKSIDPETFYPGVIPYNNLLKNTFFTNPDCYIDQCAISVPVLLGQSATAFYDAWTAIRSGDGASINSVMYTR